MNIYLPRFLARMKLTLFVLLYFTGAASARGIHKDIPDRTFTVMSPDHQISIVFSNRGVRPGSEAPGYQVSYHGEKFIMPSSMGFEIGGQPVMASSFGVLSADSSTHRSSWKPLYGERNEYADNYNELSLTLGEELPPGRKLKIIFRAYNEGIAFRYEFPQQPAMQHFTISRELTEFALAPGTEVWEEHGHEGLYHRSPVNEIQPDCELPLTIRTPQGNYGVIAEAGNDDYPRAYVRAGQDRKGVKNNTLSISLRGEAKGGAGYSTAWRMLTLGSTPGALLEQNYLILDLNRPSELKGDLSWIKPGKAIRDPAMSTASSKKFIDYASTHGLDYVIIDWGWYGPPNGEASDPTMVNVVNPGTGKPIPGHTGLDIPEVVAYGRSKGIGIWLYVNRQGLERYADKAFAQYEKWGIKGIKPGFINVGT